MNRQNEKICNFEYIPLFLFLILYSIFMQLPLSLESLKETLSIFFASRPVDKAWIFGSYARGEQSATSDIDILVDFDKDNYPSLFAHSSMICDLEDLFHTKIDLVPQEGLFPRVKQKIDKEKILIYERV